MSKIRQAVELRIGGKTRTFRYRMHEISLLEERLIKAGVELTVPEILEKQKIGILFIREAILVGVAHEFAGKRGKEARLSAQLVGRWLDACGENGNAEFDEVAAGVVEAVVLGLPGAAKAMREEKEKQEKERLALAEGVSDVMDNDVVEVGEQTDNPLIDIETNGNLVSTGKSLSSLDALSA